MEIKKMVMFLDVEEFWEESESKKFYFYCTFRLSTEAVSLS